MDLIEAKDSALRFMVPAKKEIMKWFRQDFEVEQKSDLSPVTIADRKAEEILRTKINKAYPGTGIIGELSFRNMLHNRCRLEKKHVRSNDHKSRQGRIDI